MNCYEHPDVISVATCACGRGLCGTCQGKRQPPTCDPCHADAVSELIAKTQQRLVVNWGFAVVYVIIILQALFAGGASQFFMLMAAVWGFLGFRWLLDGLLGFTRLTIFASAKSWFIAYVLGSIFCSLAGPIVIPVEIVLQRHLLKRLKAEASAASTPTAALGAAS